MTRSTGAWSTARGPTSCSPPSRARSLPRSISPGEISSALRRSRPPLAPAAPGRSPPILSPPISGRCRGFSGRAQRPREPGEDASSPTGRRRRIHSGHLCGARWRFGLGGKNRDHRRRGGIRAMAERRWLLAAGAVVLVLMLVAAAFSLGVYVGGHGGGRGGGPPQPQPPRRRRP